MTARLIDVALPPIWLRAFFQTTSFFALPKNSWANHVSLRMTNALAEPVPSATIIASRYSASTNNSTWPPLLPLTFQHTQRHRY
jgi:hypothetical protein